jgi:lipopolysaccharide export system protein LptA
MRRQHKINLILCCLLFCSVLHALPDDKQKPLTIQADNVKIDQKRKYDIYTAHVSLTQGTSCLTGDKMFVWRDTQGKIERAKIVGNLAHYHTLPQAGGEVFDAWANTMIYIAKDQRIILLDAARAQQGKMTFHGPRLDYYVTQEKVIASASNAAQATIIIEPQAKKAHT